MASSDIIKIGFDYRSSLEQFEKDTNGVFDGISNKAGKQKITIQLDAKDDKVIDKIKELQKLKLDKFTFEFGDSGLKEQLQTFDKLENKINEIINLSKGIGKPSASIVEEKQLKTIIDLFTKMESHLSSMKKVFSDVGDGEELSPLLKTIDNINTSIINLSSSIKNIGLNMNIDVGTNSESEAKIQSKMSNALQAYQRLFEHIKMSSVGGSAITDKFFQFDINQFDTMMSKIQAYRKFIENMRNETKAFFGGKDILYNDTEKKYWTQAASAMGQLTKAQNELNTTNNTNPLDNLFKNSEDLSGVIEQLTIIVGKLDEISNSAKEFSNIFKTGLNVHASTEEVEKLTAKVKELESELSKIKASTTTPLQESNISSGNTNPPSPPKKDRYAKRRKISEEDFLNYSPNRINEKLSNSGYTILGETVNTELVDGLVKVSAKIKDADGAWKSFSAKVDADGNIFEQRFKTVTNGVDKLETALENFGRETSPALTYQETLDKAQKIKNSLNLGDEYSIKVDSSEFVTITKKLTDVENAGASVTQTFKSAQDAIDNFGKAASNSAEKTSVALKSVKNKDMKDAFPDKDVSASVESATNSIKEENNVLEQNTQKVKENTQAKEQNANIDFSKYDKRLDSYNGKIDKYKTTIDRFKDGGWTSDTYLKNVQAVRDAVKQYATLLDDIKTNQNGIATDEDIQNLDKYEKKIKDTIATVTNMSASEKGYSQLAGQKEIDKINKILRENSAMSSEAKAKIKAYKQELISGNPSVSLEKIHGEIMKIVNAEELAGRAGRNFFDTLKNSGFHQLAAQMAGMFGFYDVINLGKEAISTIVSLDDALVDLKKTTAMNKTQLEDFYYDANDVAKQMGVTTEEIITQASAWSRLGYSSQEAATTMAKLSSKFASISPGMSTDEAQEGLVSIMKAFDIDPDDVETEIMDKVNVLGNKFAEENQDVIEGLKRSAAAMSAMGQSFTDTAALFTGGMEILQDSESMGTALRTLSMRVRGYDEETNQLSDDLVNVTGEVADLTKTAQDSQGVSLFTDATQEHYRSMVEYLGDIADRWDQISEKNQTELLQKLFGKNRANAGAAIIQNFDQVRAAIEAMDKSAGSSEAEMSAIESSLSYKINALKETWVGCVQDMVDRGDLGTIVTGLTKVSEAITFLLDKLGILGSIGLGAGIFSGIKNVGIGTLVAHQSNHCYCFDVPTS